MGYDGFTYYGILWDIIPIITIMEYYGFIMVHPKIGYCSVNRRFRIRMATSCA